MTQIQIGNNVSIKVFIAIKIILSLEKEYRAQLNAFFILKEWKVILEIVTVLVKSFLS